MNVRLLSLSGTRRFAIAALLRAAASAHAQSDYPNNTVRIVVELGGGLGEQLHLPRSG